MDSQHEQVYTRRRMLKTGAAGAAGAVATGLGGSAIAQEDVYGGWLAEEGTWDGVTLDARGVDEVSIDVGADGNGGSFAFAPPVILVDPGTTVRWVWTGAGGAHNVVHVNPDVDSLTDSGNFDQLVFNSQEVHEPTQIDEPGFTYEFTPAEGDEGAYPYVCIPHRSLEMKGVLVIGEGNAETELQPFDPSSGEGGLRTATALGGAAVFGTVALLGVAAYRELVDPEAVKEE
ncbi:MAG: halocyanin domain-containing protein [Halovenus sp.]